MTGRFQKAFTDQDYAWDRFWPQCTFAGKIWRLYPMLWRCASHLGKFVLGAIGSCFYRRSADRFLEQRRDVIVADTALSAGTAMEVPHFGAALQLNVRPPSMTCLFGTGPQQIGPQYTSNLCAPTQDHKKLRALSWPVTARFANPAVGDIALMFPKDPASKIRCAILETD